MRKFRMIDWLIVAVLITALIGVLAAQELPVTAYKLSLAATAGVGGYWLDRSLFPYGRPHLFARDGSKFIETGAAIVFAAAMVRRALIIGACILAVALGA